MYTYSLIWNEKDNCTNIWCFKRSDNCIIPYAHDNTDYQQFKRDIQNGVALNDASGNTITGADLVTFLNSLP